MRPPVPRFFVSADSKEVTGGDFASADSKGLRDRFGVSADSARLSARIGVGNERIPRMGMEDRVTPPVFSAKSAETIERKEDALRSGVQERIKRAQVIERKGAGFGTCCEECEGEADR